MTMIFPPLMTDRLILRCPEARDAADIARLITPEVARRVASWVYPFTLEMAQERIKGTRAWAEERKAAPFAIIRKEDGVFLGWIGVTKTAPDLGTFGYWLGEDFHGIGYMREAAPVALRAGFAILGVKKIEAGAQINNAASFAVMKACGMRPIGERTVFAPSRQVEELCAYYEATSP